MSPANFVRPEAWLPAAGISLEPNAWTVVRSSSNYSVVAGPGAGKTELLAQRACYLLQTNLCPTPRRILAISFKRDAASNLRERVEARCGRELTTRFESYTFDAFAKSLLDRFREGLPVEYRPRQDYDIPSDTDDYRAFYDRVGHLRNGLRPPVDLPGPGAFRSIHADVLAQKELCAAPIDPRRQPSSALEWGVEQIWRELVHAERCVITFDMVKRLVLFLLLQNPLLVKALRLTYSHVFLDEFQDTTAIQFDLLCACFMGSDAVLTAVGDRKQRIMLWAGAMTDSFGAFEQAFAATGLPLLCNHRSDSELVRIQQFLIDAIDPQAARTIPAAVGDKGDGVCEVLVFESSNGEAEFLGDAISELLKEDVKPRDICLLSRITPDIYCGQLIEELSRRNIKCRVEVDYQDLLRDELVMSVLAILHVASGERSPESWESALQLSCLLAGADIEDEAIIYLHEERLVRFISDLRQEMTQSINNVQDMKQFVSRTTRYYGHQALRSHFPQYRNPTSFRRIMNRFCELLWESYNGANSWSEALWDFEGVDSIPAMTIHKSKGLEYHAVFFLGLEDRAWIRFAEQQEEHKCAFFVAFSRAKKKVYFTFCERRAAAGASALLPQSRDNVASLFNLLLRAGVLERHDDTPPD